MCTKHAELNKDTNSYTNMHKFKYIVFNDSPLRTFARPCSDDLRSCCRSVRGHVPSRQIYGAITFPTFTYVIAGDSSTIVLWFYPYNGMPVLIADPYMQLVSNHQSIFMADTEFGKISIEMSQLPQSPSSASESSASSVLRRGTLRKLRAVKCPMGRAVAASGGVSWGTTNRSVIWTLSTLMVRFRITKEHIWSCSQLTSLDAWAFTVSCPACDTWQRS